MIMISDNEVKMLQVIRRNPGCTKSEIATKVQMPWSSAYATISKLQKNQFIFLDENNNSATTSNPNLYKAGIYVNGNYEYYLGISVGSSQLKIVLIGFDFSIVSKTSVDSTCLDAIDAFQKDLLELKFESDNENLCQWCKNTPETIDDLCNVLISVCKKVCVLKDSGFKLVAINFALPGYIDYYNQKIISVLNLCNDGDVLQNTTILRLISSSVYDQLIKRQISIYIDHNVKSGAIAEKECSFKYSSNVDDLIVVYLGRGVGISMIINDSLYRDKDNMSGQFGKVSVIYDKKSLELEDVIISKVLKELDIKNPSAKKIREYLEDESKSDEIHCLANVLAQALSNLIHIIGIKDIIFSGKFDAILDLFEFELNSELEKLGIFGVHLYHSSYGEYSAAVGAAMSCFNNIYNVDYSWN